MGKEERGGRESKKKREGEKKRRGGREKVKTEQTRWTVVPINSMLTQPFWVEDGWQYLFSSLVARAFSSICLRASVSFFQLASGVLWSHRPKTSALHHSGPSDSWYFFSISVSLLFGTCNFFPSKYQLVTSFSSMSSSGIEGDGSDAVGWDNYEIVTSEEQLYQWTHFLFQYSLNHKDVRIALVYEVHIHVVF